jgi:transposase-like protein
MDHHDGFLILRAVGFVMAILMSGTEHLNRASTDAAKRMSTSGLPHCPNCNRPMPVIRTETRQGESELKCYECRLCRIVLTKSENDKTM